MRMTCLIVGCAFLAQSVLPAFAESDPNNLKVVSWNLDLHEFDQADMVRNQVPADLAKIISFMEADILVLQEIEADINASGDRARNRKLSDALRLLPGDWEHVLLPAYKKSKSMRTGVAWNKDRVELLNGPNGFKVPVRRSKAPGTDLRAWLRQPHAFHFSAGQGKTDFALIPVHQKADYGSEDYSTFRSVEAYELTEALPRTIQKLREKDLMVVGRLGQKHSEASTGVFEQAGLSDVNEDDHPAFLTVDRQARRIVPTLALTRAFVTAAEPEMAEMAFEVFDIESLSAVGMNEEYYYTRVSDYLPCVMSVKIMTDDD